LSFQAGKNEAGLDHCQVRLYKAWYSYITLAMLALAFPAVTRSALADDSHALASSANEIRRMFTARCAPRRDEHHARHWSRWRHRHHSALADITTSDNAYKITKCGRST
jgi:hypothetical protein